MKASIQTRALVEGGILAALALLLNIISIYIPLFGFVRFFPLPIMILVVRHKIKAGVIAYLAVAMLLTFVSPIQGFMALVGLNLMGLVMGWCIEQNKGIGRTLLYSTIGAFVSFAAAIAFVALFLNINPINDLLEPTQKLFEAKLELLASTGASPEQLAAEKQTAEHVIWMATVIIPATFLIFAAAIAYANFKVLRAVLRKLGNEIDDLQPLKQWDFSRYLLHGWLMGLGAMLAGNYYFGPASLTYKIGLNVFFIFSAFFYVQGLAVISFYATRYKIPKLFRVLIVLVSLWLAMFVVLGGIYDMIFNFRRLERKE